MNKILLIGIVLALLTVGIAVAEDSRHGVFPTNLDTCTYGANNSTGNQTNSTDTNQSTTNTKTTSKIVKVSSGSSSSGGWCAPSWECTAWGPCQDSGYQFRVCTDKWDCGTVKGIPTEFRVCGDKKVKSDDSGASTLEVKPKVLSGEPVLIDTLAEPEDESNNELTGAVIGGNSGNWIWVALLGALILGLFGLYFARK